jgi:hypothetical protein
MQTNVFEQHLSSGICLRRREERWLAKMALVSLVVGGIIGFVASFYASLWVEFLRRPILAFRVGNVGDGTRGSDSWRFLHVSVYNTTKPPRWLRFVLLPGLPPRYSASATQAWISYRLQGKEVLKLEGRWSSTPEPLIPTSRGVLFDPSKVPGGQRENIPFGEGSAIAVGLKFDGDPEYFAFNSWSYGFPKWKNPDWRLTKARYEVVVTVVTGGYQYPSPTFILDNPGIAKTGFNLQPS